MARESFTNGLIQFGWQQAALLEYKGGSSMYHSARFIVQPQLQVLPKVRINIGKHIQYPIATVI